MDMFGVSTRGDAGKGLHTHNSHVIVPCPFLSPSYFRAETGTKLSYRRTRFGGGGVSDGRYGRRGRSRRGLVRCLGLGCARWRERG